MHYMSILINCTKMVSTVKTSLPDSSSLRKDNACSTSHVTCNVTCSMSHGKKFENSIPFVIGLGHRL